MRVFWGTCSLLYWRVNSLILFSSSSSYCEQVVQISVPPYSYEGSTSGTTGVKSGKRVCESGTSLGRVNVDRNFPDIIHKLADGLTVLLKLKA